MMVRVRSRIRVDFVLPPADGLGRDGITWRTLGRSLGAGAAHSGRPQRLVDQGLLKVPSDRTKDHYGHRGPAKTLSNCERKPRRSG